MAVLGVGDMAREISAEFGIAVHPKVLSDLFYFGHLNTTVCPVIGGRRLIPRSYKEQVVWALRRAGKLRAA
jgi:hypothetical protein